MLMHVALLFEKQITAVTKNPFFKLHLIYQLSPFLDSTDLHKLVHVFVISQLDYHNSIYTGLPLKL